jgi:DNA-directed RNA polymerase sigma subunit (sigma70/sigma32)
MKNEDGAPKTLVEGLLAEARKTEHGAPALSREQLADMLSGLTEEEKQVLSLRFGVDLNSLE